MEVLVSGLGDALMTVVPPAMVRLVQQVCTASAHRSHRAEVVKVVTSSGVSPISERVDKRHLIRHAARMQYFNVALDYYRLFALNNTGSLYTLISSALA